MPSSAVPVRRVVSRTSRLVAAAVGVIALVGAGGIVSVGAQEPVPPACAGVTVDATVGAPSVPGGSWSALDACVPLEAVYEAEVLGYQLVGGLGVATYTDGHLGRVAFVTAKKMKSMAAGRMGYSTSQVGDLIVDTLA